MLDVVEINLAVCNLLGIDTADTNKGPTKIVLTFEANKIPTAEVTYDVFHAKQKDFEQLKESFELVPIIKLMEER